jgi:hypothetical protein
VLGRLRILDGGTYLGLSTNGAGPRGRYTYDGASGAIEWAGGLKGFRYPVQSSMLQRPNTPRANASAAPFIVIHYQLRAGGNINSMSCVRTAG